MGFPQVSTRCHNQCWGLRAGMGMERSSRKKMAFGLLAALLTRPLLQQSLEGQCPLGNAVCPGALPP